MEWFCQMFDCYIFIAHTHPQISKIIKILISQMMIFNLTSTGTGRFFIICTNSSWYKIGRYFCGLHFCNTISLLTFLQQNQSSWQRRKLKGIKTCAIHTLDIELVKYIIFGDLGQEMTVNFVLLCPKVSWEGFGTTHVLGIKEIIVRLDS